MNYISSKTSPEIGNKGFIVNNRFIPTINNDIQILNDETTIFMICPKLSNGQIIDIAKGGWQTPITNEGVVVNSKQEMIFGENKRLGFTLNKSITEWFVEIKCVCNDNVSNNFQCVFGNGNYSFRTDIIVNFYKSGYPSGAVWVGGRFTDDSIKSFYNENNSMMLNKETIIGLECKGNYFRLYMNGKYLMTSNINNTTGTPFNVKQWIGYDDDWRHLLGTVSCVRIRNVAPYQGNDYENDLTRMVK